MTLTCSITQKSSNNLNKSNAKYHQQSQQTHNGYTDEQYPEEIDKKSKSTYACQYKLNAFK